LVAAPGTVTLGPGITQPALHCSTGSCPAPTPNATQGQMLRVRFVNAVVRAEVAAFFTGVDVRGRHGRRARGDPGPPSLRGRNSSTSSRSRIRERPGRPPHVEDQMTSGLYGMVRVAPTNPSAGSRLRRRCAGHPPRRHDARGRVHRRHDGRKPTGYVGHVLNGKTSLGQTPITVTQGQRVRFRFSECGRAVALRRRARRASDAGDPRRRSSREHDHHVRLADRGGRTFCGRTSS
jgi:hypothetical protein